MTAGDWLGLVCLAGIVGFFAGGFFVWNLFYKLPQPEEVTDEEPEDYEEESPMDEPGAGEPHDGPRM